MAQSDPATQVYNLVKDQVSHFEDHSKALMELLDEVGKIHPFITGTSSA